MKKYTRFLLAALAAIILVGCLAPAESAYAMYAYNEEEMRKSTASEIRYLYEFHVIPTGDMKEFGYAEDVTYGEVLQYYYNGILPIKKKYAGQKKAQKWAKKIAYELSLDFPEQADVIYSWLTDGKYEAFNLDEPANMDWAYRMGYLSCRYYETEETAYMFKNSGDDFEYDFNNGRFRSITSQGPSPYMRKYFGLEAGDDYAKRYLAVVFMKPIIIYCEYATRSEVEVIV